MDTITIFFLLATASVIIYILRVFKTTNRLSIVAETFFLAIYGFVFMIFLFPQSLTIIEKTLGVQSAINFIIYTSIFVAYFVIFILYQKLEEQRQEISKLVREIALKEQTKKKK